VDERAAERMRAKKERARAAAHRSALENSAPRSWRWRLWIILWPDIQRCHRYSVATMVWRCRWVGVGDARGLVVVSSEGVVGERGRCCSLFLHRLVLVASCCLLACLLACLVSRVSCESFISSSLWFEQFGVWSISLSL